MKRPSAFSATTTTAKGPALQPRTFLLRQPISPSALLKERLDSARSFFHDEDEEVWDLAYYLASLDGPERQSEDEKNGKSYENIYSEEKNRTNSTYFISSLLVLLLRFPTGHLRSQDNFRPLHEVSSLHREKYQRMVFLHYQHQR